MKHSTPLLPSAPSINMPAPIELVITLSFERQFMQSANSSASSCELLKWLDNATMKFARTMLIPILPPKTVFLSSLLLLKYLTSIPSADQSFGGAGGGGGGPGGGRPRGGGAGGGVRP